MLYGLRMCGTLTEQHDLVLPHNTNNLGALETLQAHTATRRVGYRAKLGAIV
jgi:hypothetical protein